MMKSGGVEEKRSGEMRGSVVSGGSDEEVRTNGRTFKVSGFATVASGGTEPGGSD